MKIIRPNIQMLASYADQIEKCKSFNDLVKIFYSANPTINNVIKGAFGENFADQICITFPNITGFSADFRPAVNAARSHFNNVDGCGICSKTCHTR